jgi:hypothetical protein
MPVEDKPLPEGNYLPAVSKEEAFMVLENARKAAEQGLQRTNALIGELFLKMEMSHNNPYEVMKPIEKPQWPTEKAQYLCEFVGINQKEALKFVNQYPVGFSK